MTSKAIRMPLSEQVYRFILNKIISGEYQPGERINIEAVSEEFGTSRTPVREAVSMLVQAGFLESNHLSGPRIAIFNISSVIQLIEVYNILFDALLPKVISSSDIDKLVNTLEYTISQHKNAFEEKNTDASFRYSVKFHEDIVNACQNHALADLTLQTQKKLDVCVSMYHKVDNNYEDSIKEHENILSSLKDGDFDLFISKMTEHNIKAFNYFYEASQKN